MSVLELSIARAGETGLYDIEITQSPVGEASATVAIDCERLLQERDQWQQALLASSVGTRRIIAGPETAIRAVGQALYETLLGNPTLASRYRSSLDIAAQRGEPLRLVLRLAAPELTPLPWEAMYDLQAGTYVSRSEPLVRRVPVAAASRPLRVQHPVRILGITASPSGLPLLDVEAEEQYLTQALDEPIRQGHIELHWVHNATWERIQNLLLSDQWHIVHFIGHGDFDPQSDEGVLALVDDNGRAHRVEASRFADLLHEARPMPRLVVLNSCLSALSGSADLFAGTASALVRGGVSAVVAMQFEITDPAAAAFARGFYTAIAAGRPVDQAVRSGRVAILGMNGHTLEWVTPVLYVRGQETRLFAIRKARKSVEVDPEDPDTQSADKPQPMPSRGGSHAVPQGDSIAAPSPHIGESSPVLAHTQDEANGDGEEVADPKTTAPPGAERSELEVVEPPMVPPDGFAGERNEAAEPKTRAVSTPTPPDISSVPPDEGQAGEDRRKHPMPAWLVLLALLLVLVLAGLAWFFFLRELNKGSQEPSSPLSSAVSSPPATPTRQAPSTQGPPAQEPTGQGPPAQEPTGQGPPAQAPDTVEVLAALYEGRPVDDVVQELSDLGFAVQREGSPSDRAVNTVLSIAPAGQVALGETITVVYSTGPDTVTLPSGMVGRQAQPLIDEITALGVQISLYEEPRADAEAGTVLRTDPVGGSMVRPGETIEMWIAASPAQPPAAPPAEIIPDANQG